jgi:hypothetical protein
MVEFVCCNGKSVASLIVSPVFPACQLLFAIRARTSGGEPANNHAPGGLTLTALVKHHLSVARCGKARYFSRTLLRQKRPMCMSHE